MLTEAEILQFINADKTSTKKAAAGVGQKYYEGNHDIKDYKLYFYNDNGELVEDTSRSNIKISHPFFTELVDQAVQYMLSGDDEFIKSDIPELQEELNKYFYDDEDFLSELHELLTGCMTKGFDYMYAYQKADGDRLAFECADAMGVIEVRAKDTDDGCEYVIYWYVDRIEKGTKQIKRIQVWDDKNTYFYVQDDEGQLEPDKCFNGSNVRPHVIYSKDDGELYFKNFGFIPFFRLDYCKKQISALKPIKEIIDDYDLMSCGLSNNLQDASEYLVVVKGFQGHDMSELMQNVRTKKHIGVEGDGGVEFKTVDIPFQARQTKLELDEKNIYRFGMGFNSAQLGDGNVTNVVIKSRYALLDLKCNKLEIRLKSFLRKILKIVLQEINDKNETDYSMKDVYFAFDREVMTNAQDNAQIELIDAQKMQTMINTLLSLNGVLDDETIIQNICDVLDISYEDIKGKLPDDELESNQAAQQTLEGVEVVEETSEGSDPIGIA